MAYLAKKEIKGKDYYYLMESARINGKPRHTKQIYLGLVEDVVEKLSNASGIQAPISSKDLELGNVAALYDVAKRLKVDEMIDEIAGKRNQGLSTGQYLLAGMINRAIHPVSKTNLEEWYEATMLSKWMPIKPGNLSSQRFWDNTERWTENKINDFETKFLKKLVKEYHLKPKCLIYDATNFFTYIDTKNEKASLARRGHSKEKRNDLRIIGLSLMFSREDEIPMFYQVYDGNRNDAKQFALALEALKQKYEAVLGEDAEVTIVFDRGNNSEANITALDAFNGKLQYVGGLKKSQCQDLYLIPESFFCPATDSELEGVSYYHTTKEVFGRKLNVVVSKNPLLEQGQLQGIWNNVEKCIVELRILSGGLKEWQDGTRKKGRKPTIESVRKNVDKILSSEYMNDLFEIEIQTAHSVIPVISYAFSNDALTKLRNEELGKNVLFTSHSDWNSEEIIKTYRSAWKIEHTFRQMKDTQHLSVRPLWSWTDSKIRVHIFCCVMALRMCCILKKELQVQNIDISINFMLESLGKKKQYIHYYKQKRGIKEAYSTSETNTKTEQIISVLRLQSYELKS